MQSTKTPLASATTAAITTDDTGYVGDERKQWGKIYRRIRGHSNRVDSRMTVASGQAQAQFSDFSSQLTLSILVVVFRWLFKSNTEVNFEVQTTTIESYRNMDRFLIIMALSYTED